MIKKALFNISLLAFGGAGYAGLEILWRGYTHWTMALCGGICLVLLRMIDRYMKKWNILKKSAAGCVAITAVEFIAGCIVNLAFGLNVWNYSGMPGNVLGQICLPFMLVWFILCIAVFSVMALVRRVRKIQRIRSTVLE